MAVLTHIAWSLVLLSPAPATGPAQAFHTLHFPGRGDLEVMLPTGSTARVMRRSEKMVALDVDAKVPRVPITPAGRARAATCPATTGLAYDLTLTLEPPNADGDDPVLARVKRAMMARARSADQKLTLIEIPGRDVAGYYYTVARRIPFASTHGCIVTDDMCFSFHLLHGRETRGH